jgi:dCTP deaminase
MVINGFDLIRSNPIKDMLPGKVRHNGVSHGLTEAGYDIRIKQSIEFSTDEDGFKTIWIREPDFELSRETTVHTGNFCLASTIEEFKMPQNLVGIVHDKSTWARMGLSVFNTVIEPGWRGHLTLELVYHGQQELIIPAGSGIAQVIFHKTSLLGSYDGKYQDQMDEPCPSRFD